jgi:bacillithiol biosynthesis cysteine-adding enzyme BshC
VTLVASHDARAFGAMRPFAAAFVDRPEAIRPLLRPLHLAPDLPEAPAIDRAALASALAVANESYGHPRARELAARFAGRATRVVVTGQQVGLLGGPLLTVHKAVSAVRWAHRIDRATPAVPVFWMATEDHDWAEITRGAFLGAGGPERFDLGADPLPLAPAGTRAIGDALPALLARLRDALPNEWSRRRFAQLSTPYRPDARFGEAFARLLVRLLGDRCPLIVDAMLPEVKAAERPILRRLVEERSAVSRIYAEAEERIRHAGFELQVPPSDASPLFLQRGTERRRIVWRGGGNDRFAVRGDDARDADIEELLATIAENPTVVSAGVLARPLVQDAILGTSLQVLGAAELAYMAQVAPLYAALGVRAPAVALRAQALTIDGHLAARLGAALERLPELLRDAAPPRDGAAAGPLDTARAAVEAALDSLRTPALELDATLQRPWEKTRESVLRSLDQFAAKLGAAESRRDATASERERRLRDLCLPFGAPQERTLTVAPAAARWGAAWVDDLFVHLSLDPRDLAVVAPQDREEES